MDRNEYKTIVMDSKKGFSCKTGYVFKPKMDLHWTVWEDHIEVMVKVKRFLRPDLRYSFNIPLGEHGG